MVKLVAPVSLLALRVAVAFGDSPCGQGSSECDDAPGVFGECCIDQSTYCVAPRGGFTTSTCCPRWTVGCTVGSVGCCDPARAWQLEVISAGNGTRRPLRRTPTATGPSPRFEDPAAEAAAPSLAYAIFTEFKGSLSAATIDASTGQLLSRRDVTGPAGDWYQLYFSESTRVLPWDAKGVRFVFADAELDSEKLTVYTVDPATGQSTGQVVSGCTGVPVGLVWDAELGALVVSTQTDAEASFFAVDPDTGAARPLGRVQRGADEGSESFYAAYLSHAHAGVAFRSGHQQVSVGGGEGLGVTKLPGTSGVTSSFWRDAAKADAHGLPVSMQRHPAGGFVSLAPRSDGKLDVVGWAANGTAQVLAQLGNAQLPTSPGFGPLGYVADAPVVDDVYATMTVSVAAGTLGVLDKWTLSTVSLSIRAVSEFALSPQPCILGAEAVSLSGFGLPLKQSPTPPTPAPTPEPTPEPTPAPTPAPTPSDCPGGSLEACLHLCPGSPQEAYVQCVKDCGERCPNAVSV